MKLRTIREHQNEFGAKFEKAVGDEYETDDDAAKGLIARGYVEKADGGSGEDRGAKRPGAGSK